MFSRMTSPVEVANLFCSICMCQRKGIMASEIAMDRAGVALKDSRVPGEKEEPLNILCSIDLCVLESTFGFFFFFFQNLPIFTQASVSIHENDG